MGYNIKKCDGGWELWEKATTGYDATTTVSGSGFPERLLCYMTAEDILQLFNETVPHTTEEPFMIGDPECKHSWRPWKFNDKFIVCNKCPAMKKIKKLIPREYKG